MLASAIALEVDDDVDHVLEDLRACDFSALRVGGGDPRMAQLRCEGVWQLRGCVKRERISKAPASFHAEMYHYVTHSSPRMYSK